MLKDILGDLILVGLIVFIVKDEQFKVWRHRRRRSHNTWKNTEFTENIGISIFEWSAIRKGAKPVYEVHYGDGTLIKVKFLSETVLDWQVFDIEGVCIYHEENDGKTIHSFREQATGNTYHINFVDEEKPLVEFADSCPACGNGMFSEDAPARFILEPDGRHRCPECLAIVEGWQPEEKKPETVPEKVLTFVKDLLEKALDKIKGVLDR